MLQQHQQNPSMYKRFIRNTLLAATVTIISFGSLHPNLPHRQYRYAEVLSEFKEIASNSWRKWDRLRLGSCHCIQLYFVETYSGHCPKPKQLIIASPLVNNIQDVARFEVVTRYDSCGDFALGITELLNDIFGYETRVVNFIGWGSRHTQGKGKWHLVRR